MGIFCVRVCGYVYTLSTSMQLLARRQEIGSFTLWKCVKVRGIIACDCSKDKYFFVSRSVQKHRTSQVSGLVLLRVIRAAVYHSYLEVPVSGVLRCESVCEIERCLFPNMRLESVS